MVQACAWLRRLADAQPVAPDARAFIDTLFIGTGLCVGNP